MVIPAVLGDGSEAAARTGAPVTGAGLSLALPCFWTPPTTSMAPAVTLALPPADRALDELEST